MRDEDGRKATYGGREQASKEVHNWMSSCEQMWHAHGAKQEHKQEHKHGKGSCGKCCENPEHKHEKDKKRKAG